MEPNYASLEVKVRDGDALSFGHNLAEFLPNPIFCNTRLAVGKIMHECGARPVIDYLFEQQRQSREEGSTAYLDGSEVMLELLHAKLRQLEA
jgi:hypothetical protein